MQVKVDIAFDQLVQLARQLPEKQWSVLKQQVEQVQQLKKEEQREAFRKLLLTGPTFSKKQLEKIARARKEINQWRTK